MSKLFYSIRWRLVLSYSILTLLTVCIVGLVALSLIGRYTRQQEMDYLKSNAEAIAHQARPFFRSGPHPLALSELARTSAFLGHIRVKVLDQQRQVLVDTGPHETIEEFVWIPAITDTWSMGEAVSRSTTTNPNFDPENFDNQNDWPGSIIIFPSTKRHPSFDRASEHQRPFSLPPGARFMIIRRQMAGYGQRVIGFDTYDEDIFHDDSAAPSFLPPPNNRDPLEPASNDPQETNPEDQSVSDRPPDEGLVYAKAIQNRGQILGYVEVSGGPKFRRQATTTFQRAFLWAGLGATFLAVVMGLGVSRGLTAPLQTLTQVAQQMGAGDLSVRAPIKGRDETSQLATQFNHMAQRLETSFTDLAAERDALRRFIADASHELRTPVTALKNFNELLQGIAKDDPEARTEFLAESDTQIQRLTWITHNLLDLSRLDAGLVDLDVAEQEVKTLLEAATTPFHPVAQEKQIDITLTLPSEVIKAQPLTILCDQARFEMALSNLLDNALKFTAPGGQIELGGKMIEGEGEQTIQIWVQDTGPGILPEEQAFLFDRFYRGQQTQQIAGSGLGLAIVQSVVQAHQGQVFVESKVGVGSRFVITVPKIRI